VRRSEEREFASKAGGNLVPAPALPAADDTGRRDVALYVLMAIVVALVIYLFYAVINPEKF
jgi:K+-transporting ATPase KdpF subunit